MKARVQSRSGPWQGVLNSNYQIVMVCIVTELPFSCKFGRLKFYECSNCTVFVVFFRKGSVCSEL